MQRDIHYRKAKTEGYRARSAYKLMEILEEYPVLKRARGVVDLCAAPGSWSQVVASQTDNCRILAIDIQEMEPIQGVEVIKGDITTEETVQMILSRFPDKVDLILCDGAPEVTGLHDLDEYFQASLIGASLGICRRVLAADGVFITKVFTGESPAELVADLEEVFAEVEIVKPKSSRIKSKEAFAICKGLGKGRSNSF
ncbi:tRNA (cytidine32/guanosine34-2'-O)-methyltransferase [Nematocida homosporus]|uniref:tRNA (cytidine32/guanosine34-2'-O)-methyltransferase n=1 Tax=Nematocida homosporus TaxID=1912981 RepID=UPI00222092F7|nr:tRNA (cytidine32/guanosine34-2'-O)-methyltransferase [Nematocida homosporus]KAI5186041.1 tRNA (cytidine32/guanosine34-2'-O)-methyltransferase [Nematocida homosporus]